MAHLLKHFKVTWGVPGEPVTFFHYRDRAKYEAFTKTLIDNQIWFTTEFVTTNNNECRKALNKV